MSHDAQSSAAGRVKACTECRQNKLRCDAHLDYSKACTRCKKKNKECVITTSFRRKKRQTKAQLRDELDRLREQYQIHPSEAPSQASPGVIGQSPGMDRSSAFTTTPSTSITPDQARSNVRPPPPLLSRGLVEPTLQTANQGVHLPRPLVPAPPPTAFQRPATTYSPYLQYESSLRNTKSLDGIDIDSSTISDLFSLFFANYALTLPDLFLEKEPEAVYQKSEFLFWSIIYTGARKYPKNATLVDKLPPAIVVLAQKNMFDRGSNRLLSTILAALIFCLWPLPINSMWKDSSHAFAGAAMQLAIQSGLHHVQNEQDFARTPLKSDDASMIFRARLWSYCLVVFQSVNICHGLPFLTIPESPYHTRIDPHRVLSPRHAYRYHMHQIQTDAVAALLRTVNMQSETAASSVDVLVDLFDDKAIHVPTPPDESSSLELNCTRLLIRAYHFLACPPAKIHISMLQIRDLAVAVVTNACDLDARHNFAQYSTQYHWSMLVLAFACLVRIKHSSLSQTRDFDSGEQALKRGLAFCDKRSIEKGDIDSRTSSIISMLWGSKKIFRTRSGVVDPLKVHLSGRLSMSVLFDCLWWWRAEFESTPNPYTEHSEAPSCTQHVEGSGQQSSHPEVTTVLQERADNSYSTPAENLGYVYQDLPYGDASFTDWNWLAGLENGVLLDLAMPMGAGGGGGGLYYATGVA